jgi:hypothetical protein
MYIVQAGRLLSYLHIGHCKLSGFISQKERYNKYLSKDCHVFASIYNT